MFRAKKSQQKSEFNVEESRITYQIIVVYNHINQLLYSCNLMLCNLLKEPKRLYNTH